MDPLSTFLGRSAMQLELLGLGAAFLVACVLIWLVIWLLIAIWVYRDAESRGMGGALWLIIVILLGLIGLIIYIVVRSDKPVLGAQPGYAPYQQPYQQPYQPPPAGRTCPRCGMAVAPGATFCPSCGNRV